MILKPVRRGLFPNDIPASLASRFTHATCSTGDYVTISTHTSAICPSVSVPPPTRVAHVSQVPYTATPVTNATTQVRHSTVKIPHVTTHTAVPTLPHVPRPVPSTVPHTVRTVVPSVSVSTSTRPQHTPAITPTLIGKALNRRCSGSILVTVNECCHVGIIYYNRSIKEFSNLKF